MSWLPSFLNPKTGSPPAPPPPPVAVSLPPPKLPHRQLLEYVVDPVRRRRVLSVVAAGAVFIALVKVATVACSTRWDRGTDDTPGPVDAAGDDDIDFGDPTEARFALFVAKLYRTHEAALLKLVEDLESLGAVREEGEKSGKLPANLLVGAEVSASAAEELAAPLMLASEGDMAALDAKIRQVAIHADEVLTQYVCKLDGAPVKGSPELKQRRREMIQAAHALGERIARFLPKPADPQEEGHEEPQTTDAGPDAGADVDAVDAAVSADPADARAPRDLDEL